MVEVSDVQLRDEHEGVEPLGENVEIVMDIVPKWAHQAVVLSNLDDELREDCQGW